MIFADLFFLYIFIPAFAICYAVAGCIDKAITSPSDKKRFAAPFNINPCRNAVLIVFSIIFYAWGEPVYVFLMIISVIINYAIGLNIDRKTGKSKAALIVGLIINIALIGVFKYANFFASSIAALGVPISSPEIPLPIGISFYTFQSISYLADVYKGRAPAQRDFFNLLLYISMFPQLIAGPIVRYETISAEINSRTVDFNDISEGSFRFIVGLGKKVILANELGEIASGFLDGNLAALSIGSAWIGIIAYTLQIYFDFSGYSDMAIGMGRCMGFHFDENFNYPYICCTITEFWRRWHISLGSFFRDYVYIPMGGNKKHQPVNILTVWMLTGFWHGASWNFLLWGIYFGVIILLEKYTILKIRDKIPSLFLHIYSLLLIIFGWVIFYFEDFGRLGAFIFAMFGGGAGAWDLMAQNALSTNIWIFIAAAIGCIPIGRLVRSYYVEAYEKRSVGFAAAITMGKIVFACAVLAVSTLLLIGNTTNAFLYTRF